MDERVWVGQKEHAPNGWTVYSSIGACLALSVGPEQIVIEDRAAILREADFLRVYEHCPLSRIQRCVGPWRAGIGRTDPTWPTVTTYGTEWASPSDFAAPYLPLTSGYDELAHHKLAHHAGFVDLAGVTVAVSLSDPQLREMWIDALTSEGAKLAPSEEAEVLMMDCPSDLRLRLTAGPPRRLIVSLFPDPWNAASTTPPEIVASVLDSPWSVMSHISQRLKRGDCEVD